MISALPSTKPGTLELNAKQVRFLFSNGTLIGAATAKLTIAGTHGGLATITNGKLTAAKGTGGQAGHSFTATFTGIGNVNDSRYKITYASIYK